MDLISPHEANAISKQFNAEQFYSTYWDEYSKRLNTLIDKNAKSGLYELTISLPYRTTNEIQFADFVFDKVAAADYRITYQGETNGQIKFLINWED